MVSVLGFRRVLVIVLLLILLGGSLFAYYGYLAPYKKELNREILNTKSTISQREDDLKLLSRQIDTFNTQKDFFNKLEKKGFFETQKRSVAQERFRLMQLSSGLVSAGYQINPITVSESELAEEAGYNLAQSPVSLNLEGLTDMDIYHFLYMLYYALPGHMQINSFDVRRVENISPEVLRDIGLDQRKVVLVEAEVNGIWSSMVEEGVIKDLDSEGDMQR